MKQLDKKGVIEVQFNWIFIIIAGAIILIIFFSIIDMQNDIQERSIANTIMMHLQSIITGAKESSNTIHFIDIPKTDIRFSCHSDLCTQIGCTSSYSIDNSNQNHISIEPIFASDLVRGKILVTWSKPWYFPFEVTSFLYTTTPEFRYIFYDSGGSAIEQLYEELPDKLSKTLTTNMSLEHENNYKVKFIFYEETGLTSKELPAFTEKLHPLDVTAINIKPVEDGIDGFGIVEFYKRANDQNKFELEGESFYLKEASLVGAIFAEDQNFYECTLTKALIRLSSIVDVYINRSETLLDYYSSVSSTQCEGGMGFGMNKLDTLKTNLAWPISLDLATATILYESNRQLNQQNDEMRNYYTCEGIF
ncbi:hypothetical protein K9M79_02400 [Candidatus Woesearchaeota archaeon]|nr:hypothetical protein [Candidatus Woesearchaeota archaeon]